MKIDNLHSPFSPVVIPEKDIVVVHRKGCVGGVNNDYNQTGYNQTHINK
jgi:hypothetical protein